MNRLIVAMNLRGVCLGRHALMTLCALLACSCLDALGQSAAPQVNGNAPFSIRATHLLGFENTKNNCTGNLSIQDNALQFQQSGKPAAQVKIAFVRDVFLGGQSKQVGGLPMTLGKTAAPFGGGRVVSLFAHKKYDTLTLEYVDSDGGVHGAIFQLNKGQGELVRDALAARGVAVSLDEHRPPKQSAAEVTHENK